VNPDDVGSMSALRGVTLLVRPRPVGQGLREQIIVACRQAGFGLAGLRRDW
jgi:hypothetical protein